MVVFGTKLVERLQIQVDPMIDHVLLVLSSDHPRHVASRSVFLANNLVAGHTRERLTLSLLLHQQEPDLQAVKSFLAELSVVIGHCVVALEAYSFSLSYPNPH